MMAYTDINFKTKKELKLAVMRYFNSKRRQGERRNPDSIGYWHHDNKGAYYHVPRRPSAEDRRKSYGRRHDELDTCNKATCQCGEWNPTTKRYEVIS